MQCLIVTKRSREAEGRCFKREGQGGKPLANMSTKEDI